MQSKLQRFGYCSGKSNMQTTISDKDQIVKGHEFHYSVFESEMDNAYDMFKEMSNGDIKRWGGGYCTGNTLGTYLHTHFCSDYKISLNFINVMEKYREK